MGPEYWCTKRHHVNNSLTFFGLTRMNPCTLGWYLPLLVHDLPGALQPSERGVAITDGDGNEEVAITSNKRARGSDKPSWQDLDERFRRDLPDELYVARLGFRGLVMRACPLISM